MSLTADVKAELTSVRDPSPTARVAELTSLLRFSGGLHSIAGRVAVAGPVMKSCERCIPRLEGDFLFC